MMPELVSLPFRLQTEGGVVDDMPANASVAGHAIAKLKRACITVVTPVGVELSGSTYPHQVWSGCHRNC